MGTYLGKITALTTMKATLTRTRHQKQTMEEKIHLEEKIQQKEQAVHR